MKKFIFVVAVGILAACGSGADQQAEREKAAQDSIARAQAAMRAAEEEALRRAEATVQPDTARTTDTVQ